MRQSKNHKKGVKVSQKTVARIMKDGDIRSKTKKKSLALQ